MSAFPGTARPTAGRGSADWLLLRADGVLETDDGALIHVTFTGVRDDANHCLRTLPRLETAAPKYTFLFAREEIKGAVFMSIRTATVRLDSEKIGMRR